MKQTANGSSSKPIVSSHCEVKLWFSFRDTAIFKDLCNIFFFLLNFLPTHLQICVKNVMYQNTHTQSFLEMLYLRDAFIKDISSPFPFIPIKTKTGICSRIQIELKKIQLFSFTSCFFFLVLLRRNFYDSTVQNRALRLLFTTIVGVTATFSI